MVGLSFFENKMWKGLGMNEDQMERLVKSFEHLAETLGDLCVIQKRRYDRDYPEQRKPREAVTSHVKTEEDLAKERQGDTDEPIREWLGGFEDEGFIGEREKAFLEEEKQRNASTSIQPEKGSNKGSVEAAGNKTRGRRKRTADNA